MRFVLLTFDSISTTWSAFGVLQLVCAILLTFFVKTAYYLSVVVVVVYLHLCFIDGTVDEWDHVVNAFTN